MAKFNSSTDLTDALSAPLGDLIAAVGRGIADAQQALDAQTIESFKALYRDEDHAELLKMGYQPTWYKIPQADAEISISLSISGQTTENDTTLNAQTSGQQSNIQLYAAPVDASYTNKYDYDLQAASHLKFRIVPVPPSPQASEVKIVPNLLNKSFVVAKTLLERLGINYQVADGGQAEDSDIIQNTTPIAGEFLETGQMVELTLEIVNL